MVKKEENEVRNREGNTEPSERRSVEAKLII